MSECNSGISHFSLHPPLASPRTPLITHTHTYLDFGSKREKDWITDWHNNSRKQSGAWEAGLICGHMGWCNEKQNFLTPELCDPLKPWNPAPLFLAGFPPKLQTSLNVCIHTHTHIYTQHPPTWQPPHLNFSARPVYLESIEQMSDVIRRCLIHIDYCWGYWCPQIKVHLCLS